MTGDLAKLHEPAQVHDETSKDRRVSSLSVIQIIPYGTSHVEACRRIQARIVNQARQQTVDSAHFFFEGAFAPDLKCFFSPCQHSKYSCCKILVFMANSVGRTTS